MHKGYSNHELRRVYQNCECYDTWRKGVFCARMRQYWKLSENALSRKKVLSPTSGNR